MHLANLRIYFADFPECTFFYVPEHLMLGDRRNSSDQDRIDACNAMAKVCTDNSEELAVLLTKEQGKPLGGMGSQFELGGCGAWAGFTAGLSLPEKNHRRQ